jgi:hypothetical protein
MCKNQMYSYCNITKKKKREQKGAKVSKRRGTHIAQKGKESELAQKYNETNLCLLCLPFFQAGTIYKVSACVTSSPPV